MSYEDKISILVVEDADFVRQKIAGSLRMLGFSRVTGVSNGKAAIEFLVANKVDLILSDWYMDPINGIELVRAIRQDPKYKNIAFVMISGEMAKEKVLFALKSGIDGYVLKPYTLNQLGIKLNEALKRKNKV